MINDIFDFIDQGVLKEPYPHAAGTQRRHLCPQAFRTVNANHGNLVSIFKSETDKAQCDVFYIFKIIVPGDGEPYAKLLLTHGYFAFTVLACLCQKQLGYR